LVVDEDAGRDAVKVWFVGHNVRVNRPGAAGWLGPGWDNVPRAPGRAKAARRSGSGGSTRG
jgi:hypothetical protein